MVETVDSLPPRPLEYKEAMALHRSKSQLTPLSFTQTAEGDLVYTLAYLGKAKMRGIAFDADDDEWVIVAQRPENCELKQLSDRERDRELSDLSEEVVQWATEKYNEFDHEMHEV